MSKIRSGFTLVELLIVIVIIAILAAITLVAYNGIQQRANNSAINTAGNQAIEAYMGYITGGGSSPITTNGWYCMTQTCMWGGTSRTINTTLSTALNTFSTLPSSTPSGSSTQNGLIFSYSNLRTLDGNAAPVLIIYYLQGNNITCAGGAGTLSDYANGGGAMATATTPYSMNSGNTTMCAYSLPAS
jgi:prepilin-type N-terminal cleavage/methylation domain-containing protein